MVERILEENQKKIEEAQRKLVSFNITPKRPIGNTNCQFCSLNPYRT